MSSTQHQLIEQCATRLRGIVEALDNIHDNTPHRWSTDLDDVHSSAESLLALIKDQAPTQAAQGLAGAALAQPSPAPAEAERPEMSPERAAYFMRRFKSEEKLLGPNEQAAVDYVLSLLAQHDRIAGALRYKAELYDEVWALVTGKGYMNVTTAIAKLEQERDAALARVAELEMLLRKLSTNGLMQFSTVDEEMAVQAALGGAPVAQAQQLHDLDKQCRDDVARALGLRPNQERGFAWSYLLTSIKSCVKASEDSAQAQHSVPEEFSFEYRHPNGESHTVTVSRDQVINEMPDFLFEALCSKFCNCEPVGETNVVECCCDEYAEEFKLLAAAPGKEGG